MCLSNCICQNDHYHDCIVHDYIQCGKFLNGRTNERTDKAILGVGFVTLTYACADTDRSFVFVPTIRNPAKKTHRATEPVFSQRASR